MAIKDFYSPEIEQHLLGILLAEPTTWGDVNMVTRNDFSVIRRHLFDAIKGQLDAVPQLPVTPIILVEKLKSYGQSATDVGGVDLLAYLTGLSDLGRMLRKEEARALMGELKLLTVKREQMAKCDEVKQAVAEAKTFGEIVKAVDSTLTAVTNEYFKTGETEDVFQGMRDLIEERGNQEKEELGYVGVIPAIDRTLGPLFFPGAFTNISSRSGGGKSSFGFYYAIGTAEKHNLPLLWLDAGEMTKDQLRFRAACCFSEGLIPLWAVRSNGWRRNKEWTAIMRDKVLPRCDRLIGRMAYKNVGGMTPKEKIAFVRRHYFNKVGRGNFLLIVDDYLKGIEAVSKETKEYQSIGYYTSDMKSLVTAEINAGFMTFTQSNRFGVSKGKKEADIVDNDSVISLSDRIKDNCTANFLMRYKVATELARERNLFGNVLLKVLKIREGLGHDYEQFARPVKMANGSFAEDYFNLDYHGFHYRDMGLFSELMKTLGHVAVDLSQREGTEEMP